MIKLAFPNSHHEVLYVFPASALKYSWNFQLALHEEILLLRFQIRMHFSDDSNRVNNKIQRNIKLDFMLKFYA